MPFDETDTIRANNTNTTKNNTFCGQNVLTKSYIDVPKVLPLIPVKEELPLKPMVNKEINVVTIGQELKLNTTKKKLYRKSISTLRNVKPKEKLPKIDHNDRYQS